MGGFVAILTDDLYAMFRSVTVWSWLVITALGSAAAVVVAAAFTDTTSFILGWGLTLYLGLGSFVIIVLSANAASGELGYLGDAIMSRGLTPVQYISAKLLSRLVTVQAMFLLVVPAAALGMLWKGTNDDIQITGMILGLTYVALFLALLVCLGVMLSSFIPNILLAVALLVIIWYIAMGIYVMFESNGFTPEGVLGELPGILRGSFEMAENWPVMLLMIFLMAVLSGLSILSFHLRDL
ncbi:hypothetical protein FIM02_01305 [SAR202 cluster bacterium AD-802-E10_MRT_200m]|nr:hypothetical protein [SAR202 cluster bacterium AD-802-E10_MRT_200m]MQF82782.1 hypothetical protein [SAR202 cluster bacterium AD-802-E10_MRT_200m]